ncbi:aminoglycoside phosphotransferase, partial [Chrysochromulina tobinii]
MARNGVQDVGLFWDFLSLPQHLVDRVRTAEEALVFKAGLGCLASLYSHQFTHVIQLKDAPGRDYDASGWCFFEQSVASVMKAESMLLDLSKVSDWTSWKGIVQGAAAFHLPPLHPDAFDEQISLKTFTNGSDSAVVKGLYRSFYNGVAPKPWILNFLIKSYQAGTGADWGGGPRAAEAIARLVKAAPDFTAVLILNINGHSFTREQLDELLPAFERMRSLQQITLDSAQLDLCSHLRNRLWKVKGIKLWTGRPGGSADDELIDDGEDAEVVPDHKCVEAEDGSLRLMQLVADSRALLAREVVIHGSDEDRISAIDEAGPPPTTAVRKGHEIDVSKVLPLLREAGGISAAEAAALPELKQFGHGQSNPTYLLTLGARRLVVRKQPPGKLLRGAHAVDREFMAMSALKTTAVPVPKTLLFVEDAEVLGTPFFVCEYVDGRFFKDPSMRAAGSPQERAALYGTFMRTVAALHTVDFAACGLKDFGK